jgi:hypothetical protein
VQRLIQMTTGQGNVAATVTATILILVLMAAANVTGRLGAYMLIRLGRTWVITISAAMAFAVIGCAIASLLSTRTASQQPTKFSAPPKRLV